MELSLLDGDGRFDVKEDHKNFDVTYTPENPGIMINPGRSAKASCGETSLNQQYLPVLGMWSRADKH
jgi:hypothetical protein